MWLHLVKLVISYCFSNSCNRPIFLKMCIIRIHELHKAPFYVNRVINTEISNSLNCQNQYAYKFEKSWLIALNNGENIR